MGPKSGVGEPFGQQAKQRQGVKRVSAYLDTNPDNVNLLRKMGLKVFYGDSSRHDLLHAAGAVDAELIIIGSILK